MDLNMIFYIFVYIIVVSPISDVVCHRRIRNVNQAHGDTGHKHPTKPPCAACPRHGKCVPRVQCPAHVRSTSNNPVCHLKPGITGVCCFTGHGHASESDHKFRASSMNVDDLQASHEHSKVKLEEWMGLEKDLMKMAHHTILNSSVPGYGHHLSLLTYDPTAALLGRGGLLNMFAALELKSRQALSDDELSLGLTGHTDGPFCEQQSPACSSPTKYRHETGACNNQAFPSWGAAHTGLERLLPPAYTDGIWSMRSSAAGVPLPSPRTVSTVLLLDGDHPSPTHNLLFMQFGQFVAHDVSAAVVFNLDSSPISCCSPDGSMLPPSLQHPACAPIFPPPSDQFYANFNQRCLNFVRAQPSPSWDCTVGYVKQMNGATHFLDLSHLYGSSQDKMAALRSPGGALRTFNDFGRELPPLTTRKECLNDKEGAACFDSGDNHGNQIISLTLLHTIFTREHNRIANAMARLNPEWNEDTLFMESRRIVQAEFQHILYSEWIPVLLGPALLQAFELSPSSGHAVSYDSNVNPSLTAEFSTAAMRFGHSVVDGKINVPKGQSGEIYETVSIPEVMFQPSRLRLRPYFDRMLMGLTMQPMQSVDPFVTEGLTRYLFHGGNPFGLDLASINIQRGRDYGVRPYNDYRRLIGLERIADFREFTPNAAQRLSSVYSSPDDIDLWVGGLLEEPVEGGVVGNSFANILADQFSRLKKGDRYFYDNSPDVNPGAFTPSQLAEIKKVTMARLICDNRDGIELVVLPPNAFFRADLPGNEPVPCDSQTIQSMDLSRFREM